MGDRTGTPASNATSPAFDERQRLPDWVGPAVLVLSAAPLLFAIIVVVGESGVTLGSIGTVAVIVGCSLGVVPLVYRSELRTQVRDDGVYFRFRPFHRSWRSIPFSEIEGVRRDQRRAFQYGIRWTRQGWEYRPNSGEGVEIDRTDEKPIFLGSDRPRELRTAIEDGMSRTRR